MSSSSGNNKAVGSIPDVGTAENDSPGHDRESSRRHVGKLVYTWICITILFANYFLAQYDKFILSYFQNPLSTSLNL